MNVEIVEDESKSRYQVSVGGSEAGVLDYRIDGTRMLFTHTETFPEFRGQGVAAHVVRRALDDAADRGRTVVPLCWYVRDFIAEHPDYVRLVEEVDLARFRLVA